MKKRMFWEDMDEEMKTIRDGERVIIGGDMNGHVGKGNEVISRIHGGEEYEEHNIGGERIIDFAVAHDVAVMNIFLSKRPEHLITSKSDGRSSQIDYMLYRMRGLKEVENCKVVPGDHVAPQHSLLCMDITLKRLKRFRVKKPRKIKWFKLREMPLKAEFKERVLGEIHYDILN